MAFKRSRATFEADLQAQQSPHVIYGTPLPPLDSDSRDDGSYVPVWKQEVTDEQGRKRLHGAFTGGFSAGYFNTVGSKEGWTPSTFVSSRSNRKTDAVPNQQRPEDFMDEEDMAEAEEAKKIQTTDSFAGLGSTTRKDIQDDSLMDILRTAGETMGSKLLKRMGWREGQGVGPKVRRKARIDEDQDVQDRGGQETYFFAPANSNMISFIKKFNRNGLGFEGEGKLEGANSPTNEVKLQNTGLEDEGEAVGFGSLSNGNKLKKKKPERKGGLGVGILNDNGSDDEDPYAMGPQISYNRIVGGDKKKKKKSEIGRPSANPLLNSKPVFISKKAGAAKSATSFRRCHDGRLPLDGFVLSSNSDTLASIISQDGKYPPPTIPQDWKSSKTHHSSGKPASERPEYQSSATAAPTSKLSPKSRAALLGESLLPGKSVFDFLTTDARTRITSATNNDNLPPALGEVSTQVSSNSRTLQSLIPPLARETAQTALGRGTAGWMPYAEDLAKRARYRTFLEIRAGLRPEGTLPERTPRSSNDDWVNEMKEFAHAAQIFKPMTGAMATRFTSSSSTPQLASDNLKQEAAADSTEDMSLLSKPTGKAKTPAEEAAAVGMYGPLTRSVQNFYPTRLLCKRFNIQPPAHVQVDPGGAPPGSDVGRTAGDTSTPQTHSTALPQKSLELIGKKAMGNLRMTDGGVRNNMEDLAIKSEDRSEAVGQRREQAIVIDPERNEALEKERPGEAVFKAIFGSETSEGHRCPHISIAESLENPQDQRNTITLSATRDSSDGSSVSDKISFRASIVPCDAEPPYTESADDEITAAPSPFPPSPPSSAPPAFSSLYFPPQTSPDRLEASVTEPPPPAFTPVSSAAGLTSAEAETKAALPANNKGESSKSAEDEEAPPPYTEGSSPLDSFTYVMAAAGGAASIITQVQQGGPAPVNTLADVGADEHITLDLRGIRFTLSREELLTLPEFVLLSLFPNGLLPDGHMNSFHEGDIYPVDYDPQSLQYMLEFFRTVAQTIPSGSPSPSSETPAPSSDPSANTARDMLQDRAGIIVLREDLDFYAIPPKAEIDQTEMTEVKRAAGRALLRQDGIFSGLRRSEESGTTEQHLIEMLTAGGFNNEDRWGHRAGEPQKAVICSLALARLRTDTKGSEGVANSNAVGMAQKLLLFWRKPARRCWWEGVELEDVEGVEGKLKVWIRRVWTLEMSVIGLR